MSLLLRIILIIVSIGTFFYMVRKIRKSQVQIIDVSFWIIFSLVLIIIALVPKIALFMADVLQVATTVNFVFLTVIFLLLLQVFLLSIKVSKLESKLKELAGEIALDIFESNKMANGGKENESNEI